MQRDEINAIKELANLQIEDVFDVLGISYRERYYSLTAPCPIHGGKRQDAFSFHVERGTWKCFSRNCDEIYGSDIFGLVKGIRDYSFIQAVEWVKNFINVDLSEDEIRRIKDSKANRDFIISVRRRDSQSKRYPWECLKKLAWHDYLVTQRGFPESLIKEYHIGACLKPNMYMSNRVVIPIINIDGEIVGFTGRTLDNNWKENSIPKWKHSLGSWVEVNVFNSYRANEYVQNSGIVIVCEGPLDVLRLEQAGIHNAIGLLGKKLHDGQLTVLMNMGATRLILALDNDVAGKIGTSGAMKTAQCLFDISEVDVPAHRNDIGDMSLGEIKEIFYEYAGLQKTG